MLSGYIDRMLSSERALKARLGDRPTAGINPVVDRKPEADVSRLDLGGDDWR